MGLTIKNEEMSIKMSYIGFAELCTTIAKLLSPDFAELYIALCKNKISNEILNKKLNLYFEKGILKNEDNDIIEFLFMPDYEGHLSFKKCERLYEVIKDYNDNVLYGYKSGMFGYETIFADFKELVKICIEKEYNLEWY